MHERIQANVSRYNTKYSHVSRFRKVSIQFWLHAGDGQLSSVSCLTKTIHPQSSCHADLLLFIILCLTSSFAAVTNENMCFIQVKQNQGAAIVHVGSLESLRYTKWNGAIINQTCLYLLFHVNMDTVNRHKLLMTPLKQNGSNGRQYFDCSRRKSRHVIHLNMQ